MTEQQILDKIKMREEQLKTEPEREQRRLIRMDIRALKADLQDVRNGKW